MPRLHTRGDLPQRGAPHASYSTGYYDNPYDPYWSYRGPLGQGSGSDMRIGR